MQSAQIQRALWVPSVPRTSGPARDVCVAISIVVSIVLSGCGMPGAPLPPSLNLPVPVINLSAVRTGGQVALNWTMPTKTTDKVLLKGNISVRVCRNENGATQCQVAATLEFPPAADAAFTDTLPSPLTIGSPRVLTYFVELVNRNGRSAGPSNRAQILAGDAPSAVEGLTAEMRKNGILLRWAPALPDSSPVAIRLVRRLLTPPVKNSGQTPLAHPNEPLEQTLIVEPAPGSDRALDTDIRFGSSYEYRAQRVLRNAVDGSTLELAGPLSPRLLVDAINIFPPSVPKGLEAVATAGENGSGPAIDLSWLPGTESDLAGYIVYRREKDESGSVTAWHRISAQPVAGPGFHDSDVQPGHTYIYVVTAIDLNGHESAQSAEASVAVPAPWQTNQPGVTSR